MSSGTAPSPAAPFDLSGFIADQLGLGGTTDNDRLLAKYFLYKSLYDAGTSVSNKLFESEEEELRKANLRLQNQKLRQDLPMNDDEYGEGVPSSLTALFATKGSRAVPRPKFLDNVRVPSVLDIEPDFLSRLGKGTPNVRSSLASKLFLRR